MPRPRLGGAASRSAASPLRWAVCFAPLEHAQAQKKRRGSRRADTRPFPFEEASRPAPLPRSYEAHELAWNYSGGRGGACFVVPCVFGCGYVCAYACKCVCVRPRSWRGLVGLAWSYIDGRAGARRARARVTGLSTRVSLWPLGPTPASTSVPHTPKPLHHPLSGHHHLQPAERGVDGRAQRPGPPPRAAAGERPGRRRPRARRPRARPRAPCGARFRGADAALGASSDTHRPAVAPCASSNRLPVLPLPATTQVHWLRVVLDEGHTLGSPNITNKLAMACEVRRGIDR